MVPFDSITITPNILDGYITPTSYLFTPNSPSQTLSLEWEEKPMAVSIMDKYGNIVNVTSWTSSMGSTGVVLNTDNVSIVIAPVCWYRTVDGDGLDGWESAWNGNYISAWGGIGTTVTGIKTTTSESDAMTDFSGSANTDAIISQLTGKKDEYSQYYTGAPAAEYCRAYSKGCKGAGEWYLPAAGEALEIVNNINDITAAMNVIYGFDPSLSPLWTSTQFDENKAYCASFTGSSPIYSHEKGLHSQIRPICQIS